MEQKFRMGHFEFSKKLSNSKAKKFSDTLTTEFVIPAGDRNKTKALFVNYES